MHLNSFPNAVLDSPSSSGSRNLVSIKVQPVIQAFKECSKWQESLGSQFVFSWGAMFVAFSFPQGNKGNQLQLVEDYESYWPLTPAVEVTWGFPEEGYHCYKLQSYIFLPAVKLCCLSHLLWWKTSAQYRYKSCKYSKVFKRGSLFIKAAYPSSSTARTHEQEDNILMFWEFLY